MTGQSISTLPKGAASTVAAHAWDREVNEHYVEPEWCSRRLFEEERFEGGILDPCCGFGRIVESAKVAGHHAIGSDIEERAPGYMSALDFLTSDYPHEILMPGGECANVVCNPPFVWDKQHTGPATIGWLHRDKQEQSA